MPWKDKEKIAEYKKRYIANPEKRAKANARINEWRKKRRAENPELWRQRDREYYQKRRGEFVVGAICKKRGLTSEQYWELVAAADGKCNCCGRPFDNKGPCIDHCHTSGAVRGVLCNKCNTAEGHMGTAENALKLYEYMKRNEELLEKRE